MQSIGQIREIEGPVVVVDVHRLPPLGQALRVEHDERAYVLEVHQHLDERSLRTVAMNSTTGLRRGLPVFDTGAPLTVPVGESCLGRVLDLFGKPLDSGPNLAEKTTRDIRGVPVGFVADAAEPATKAWGAVRLRSTP